VRPRTLAAREYASAKLPPARTPWRQARFCVVDLETTGLDPKRDEIVSFAAIPVDEGRVLPGGLVMSVVRPERMPPPETIRIHGLRPADLEGAPPLREVLDELLGALAGRILVAHSASLERGFLRAALREHGVRLRRRLIDTARLAETALAPNSGTRPIALSALASGLGLPVHRPHHPDGDALTTAQVFIALAARLDRERSQTVRSLERAGRP
jgi:DNA polymerase-3 subunit epsilon